jgi:hypothetical protein
MRAEFLTIMQRLELIREAKLSRLIPGRSRKSRLEASGVALMDEDTAVVVFDNLNQIARVRISLEPTPRNALSPAPSLGSGFEDVATDRKGGLTFALVEAVEDFDGVLRGFVAEYDREGVLLRCERLPGSVQKANKGFEGVAHARDNGREYLYALREANSRTAKGWRGRIDVYVRASQGAWKKSHRIDLPREARFKDYSALAYRHDRIAIVSQESARLWVARLDAKSRAFVRDSSAVYRFPDKHYRNVEGIDWLSEDTLIAVSDRAKKGQPASAAKKDQSIHVFRIPK